jgi:hypothetical protein
MEDGRVPGFRGHEKHEGVGFPPIATPIADIGTVYRCHMEDHVALCLASLLLDLSVVRFRKQE